MAVRLVGTSIITNSMPVRLVTNAVHPREMTLRMK